MSKSMPNETPGTGLRESDLEDHKVITVAY